MKSMSPIGRTPRRFLAFAFLPLLALAPGGCGTSPARTTGSAVADAGSADALAAGSFGQVVPLVGLTPLLVKIWFGPGVPPSSSCQVTHGTGSLPATAAPPWTTGLTASRLVWMFNDGTGTLLAPPLPRPCPAKIHLPWLTSPVLSNVLGAVAPPSCPKKVLG